MEMTLKGCNMMPNEGESGFQVEEQVIWAISGESWNFGKKNTSPSTYAYWEYKRMGLGQGKPSFKVILLHPHEA